ncbi:28S ribosomal protein S27, mitochondrial [Lamellibrachia satsuma]|nr:28S ribosomal protein S27, mitochondrial [Lamellibrachia satsuma]
MWRRVLHKCHVLRNCVTYECRRTLLSEAYACQDMWQQRLQTPLLQQCDASELAVKLSEKFEKEGKTSAIDMDILANKLSHIDSVQLDFVQSIFHKYRHTNECLEMPDSTPYAVVRCLLEMGETERVLQILQDKINYGIFLDDFTANLLMDHFIENKMYQEAALVAYDLMLQEQFNHPITRALAWYACHLHWKNRPPPSEQPTEPEEDDEKQIWIRVRFIENPWYDNHFDLDRDLLKLGKTLVSVARGNNDLIGRSYQLIGLALYEKFETGLKLLRDCIKLGAVPVVTQEAIDQFRESLEGIETKEPPEENKDPGMVTMEDVKPFYTEEQKTKLTDELQEVSTQLAATDGAVAQESLEEALRAQVRAAIDAREAQDIDDQSLLLLRWNGERQERLDAEMERVRKLQKKASIEQRLKELKSREERLRFFEEEDKIHLSISQLPRMRPIEDVKEEEQFVGTPAERGKGF